MEFLRAFTYMFRDRHCLRKLAEMALFVLLCPVPVIGLFCLCALLGYLAEIIHNVSNDYPRPLPVWDHIGEDIGKGAHVLLAIVIYHLPPLVVVAALYFFRDAMSLSLFGGLTFLGALVGILPFLLIYFVIAWALLAAGLVQYAETWESGAFYDVNRLLRHVGSHSRLTLQWLAYSLAASMLLLALLPVALLGLLLFFPVQGYLTGNYGRRLRAAKLEYRQAPA